MVLNMRNWIIPCNVNEFDLDGAFQTLDELEWTQGRINAEEGDHIFIYVGKPVQAIKYQCVVTKADLKPEECLIDDSAFSANRDQVVDSDRYMRIKMVKQYGNELNADCLQEHGVRGSVIGPRVMPEELDNYIQKIDTVGEGDMQTTTINCLGLLDYLMDNGGKSYKSPDKAPDEEKPALLEIKENGRKAIKTLKAIGEACSKEYGPFKIDGGNWLDASYTKVREYLWAQLKYPEFNDSPESISIFVEKDENTGEARFRISLEIKDTGAKKDDYAKHYKSLEMPLETEQGFRYFLGGNNSDIEYGASEITDPAVIRKKLDDGEIKKVQISCCIGRDDVSSNDEMLQRIVDAAGVAKGYYDHVMGVEDASYWPTLSEYDPGLTKEDYKNCMSNPDIVKYDNLDTVYRIYQMGGEATCKQIAGIYGNSDGHYRQNAQHVA